MSLKKKSNCDFSVKIVFKQWLQVLTVHVSMITPKRLHPKILLTTLVLKYIFKFQTL
jgi:hypothetical protein